MTVIQSLNRVGRFYHLPAPYLESLPTEQLQLLDAWVTVLTAPPAPTVYCTWNTFLADSNVSGATFQVSPAGLDTDTADGG